MFKKIQYLLASLFVICFIAACGGGGGGSAGPNNGPGNIPVESPPVESPPVESQPVESSNPSPAVESSVISISTNLNTMGNTVVAGHAFTITAKSVNGSSGIVNFANNAGTPSGITYSPTSCAVTSGSSCTTTATIGLGTPAISLTPGYTTIIGTTTSNVTLSTAAVTFAVATPQLSVTVQPVPYVVVDGGTTVGFTLAESSIPLGSNSIQVSLGASSSIVSLSATSCTISYANGRLTLNTCSPVNVAALGAGNASIIASATNFISANTNQTSISSAIPAFAISTNLTQPANSVAAGHTFTITATSQNGAIGTVNFANSTNTPGSITYNPAACNITASTHSCATTVTVGLNTAESALVAAGGYSTKISFTNGTSLPDQTVKFGVYKPILTFVQSTPGYNGISNPGTLISGKSVLLTLTIESSSIPAGSGSVAVNLGVINPGIVSFQNAFTTCSIAYLNQQITSNTCTNLVTGGFVPGKTTITAAANLFANAADSIVVTKYIMYVAENAGNSISMYTADNTGVLTALNQTISNVIGPRLILRHPSGKFLYVSMPGSLAMYSVDTSTGGLAPLVPFILTPVSAPMAIAITANNLYMTLANNTVITYGIDSNTGQLTYLGVAATGSTPSAIAVSPNGKYAYVSNLSDNNVYQYTINQSTGVLQPCSPAIAPSSMQGPSGIAVDATSNFVYVTSSDGYIWWYSINTMNGNLLLRSTTPTLNSGGTPSGIMVDPLTNIVYVVSQTSNMISTYSVTPSGQPTFGQLQFIGLIATGSSPGSLVLDPSGAYAYVTNQLSNSLSMYATSNGQLKPLYVPTVATGSGPRGINY